MALVLDTHAVVWYLSGSKQLSPTARTVIASAERNAENIFVSAISLVEVIYLVEKGRLPALALQRLQEALRDPTGSMVVAPLDAAASEAVQESLGKRYRICRIALSQPLLLIWTPNSSRATGGCISRGFSRLREFASCRSGAI
jgi:PIN domain nuclease of toxin-antitoxin system